MANSSTPGAVVLFRTPNQEYLQAFGIRGIGSEDPITIDDYFRIGSNTKTMTGTVLLRLVSEGMLSLEVPFPPSRATFRTARTSRSHNFWT
jgi:D-alanyl-D-alanine carboxypeptidase